MGQGLKIHMVEAGSIAAELGVAPGDRVTAINESLVRDLIDYRYLIADEILNIDITKENGEEWVLEVEKDPDENLGLDFGADGFGPVIKCANKCFFCFVDQMPSGMRKTLYVKDDDYRLSFWNGNFITLTNLSKNTLERIARQRLSPLYISVHTTNSALRERMLGNPRAGSIMEQLGFLAEAGIEMHTQVVLCPGLNDGVELEKTARDLASFWPAVRSLAVVPVGLTRFRDNLYPLKVFTPGKARLLVHWVHDRQEKNITCCGHPFIFAADEFYLLAEEPVPAAEKYDGFPQLENGVGLTRLFIDEWASVACGLPNMVEQQQKIVLVTGVLGYKILEPVATRLNEIAGLEVIIKVIENVFFGRLVTATGLVTGSDILAQVSLDNSVDLLVLPTIMLKEDQQAFLDGIILQELAEKLKIAVAAVTGPSQLVDTIVNNPAKAEVFIDWHS